MPERNAGRRPAAEEAWLPDIIIEEDGLDALPDADEEGLERPARRRGRLATLRARLPRFSDGTQKKAAVALVRFFAAILALTFIARGTAGATLPKVDTTRPERGEIIQRVRGSGTVKAGDDYLLPLPDGLTVQDVLVSPGQSVNAGDTLARFDAEEVEAELLRAKADLDAKNLKMKQLLRKPAHDASALEAARTQLARAQQDYDRAKTQGDADIAAARQALATAEADAQAAWDAIADKGDTSTPEYKAWEAQKAAEDAARDALAQTETRVAAELLAAERALEDARTALANAEKADADARQTESDTAAQNDIDASALEVDIAEQQKKVDALQAIKDAGGTLTAEKAGVVQMVPEAGGKTGEGGTFRLADPAGRYEAELWIDKKDAEKLAPGDACEVAQTGGSLYYRPTATGTVASISDADADGKVKVTIRLPEGEWKAGQTVEAQVVQDRQTHDLCVPLSALHSSNEGYYLLVLQEKETVLGKEMVAAKVPVTVKAQDDTMAAVEGPLSDRDKVITGSNKAVQPDDTVRENVS